MDPLAEVEVGNTGLRISRLGLGSGALGNLFAPVPDEEARWVVERALACGIRYFDTAPVYGMGLAEQRVGRVLSRKSREEFVISTKVGRLLREDAPPDEDLFHNGEPFFKDTPQVNPVWDFSYEGTYASLAESLDRLSLAAVDIVYVHEPPRQHLETAIEHAHRALVDLRREGTIRAIGVGWDDTRGMARFVAETDCDCVLLAGRYTLLNQSALEELLPLCVERGASVVVGGVFNSGIGVDPCRGAKYDYIPATPEMLTRARCIEEVCARFGVQLKAAALWFPFGHPAVASVLVGARSVTELEENLVLLMNPIPSELWSELRRLGLLDERAPLPTSREAARGDGARQPIASFGIGHEGADHEGALRS